MMKSLSSNSMKQYDSSLKLWWKFCNSNNIDTYQASVPYVLKFLSECFESGASYGTLNTTRSALSLIIGPKLGSDDRIKRFMKGVFRSKPPNPKYNVTWDPGVVLNHLAGYPMESVTLEKLTKKLVTILALTTGHRVQTLSLIDINNISFNNNVAQIYIPDIIKSSKKGNAQPVLYLKNYDSKVEICPVTILRSYIEMTKPIRQNNNRLLITYKKPYHPASPQSISRWIKCILKEAGIDLNIFSAHSTRHASTSAAQRSGVSIEQIQKTAGWSNNSLMFAKHYNRPVVKDPTIFSKAICDTIL